MNARFDITAPLEIEITEAEILADLLYPASPPSPVPDIRDQEPGDGRWAGRGTGRIREPRREPARRRDRAAA